MKMKSLLFAALFVLFSNAASATTQIIDLVKVGLTYTAGYSVSHLAGEFTDTFIFTPSEAAGITDTSFINTASSMISGIVFSGATLNGYALSVTSGELFTGTFTTIGALSPTYLGGDLILTVTGNAGANASYAGTINILTSVPEPGTYGMLLGGLGLLGFMVRRRQQR